MTDSIPITSCHICSPKTWKPSGPSVATYKCLACGRTIQKTLERRLAHERNRPRTRPRDRKSTSAR